MSQYALSEAYSEIYDHRKIEESFDNFRFVDYMLPEHLEEVIEELVWEFRDYGNTLEESFEMIDYALEDQVICESYDQLIVDVLYEATVPKGKDRSKFAGSAQGRVTTGKTYRFDPQEVERRAKRLGQVKTASRSVKSRMSKLSGPISSVKQGIAGSAGGMGRAVKAAGGAVVERGKALLKGLLRRGGKTLSKTGKQMMASGTSAAKSGLASRQAGKATSSGQMALDFEPSTKEKAGGAATSVGRAIRKVGASLQRKAGKEPLTRDGYEKRKTERAASAKKEVGDAFAKPAKPVQTGPVRASIGRVQPGPASRSAETLKRAPMAPAKSERKYPVDPSGQTSLFTGKGPKGKPAGPDVKVPSGGQKKFGKAIKPKSKEKTRQMPLRLKESDYELLMQNIAEDLIEAGYTSNINESYDLIDQMDESTLYDIIQEYLD